MQIDFDLLPSQEADLFCFFWCVDNDYMRPLLKRGDFAVVKKLEFLLSPLKKGNVVFYRVGKEYALRYIDSVKPLRLLSLNGERTPLEIVDKAEDGTPHFLTLTRDDVEQGAFEIIGKVVQKVSIEKINTIYGSNTIDPDTKFSLFEIVASE